MSLITTGTTTVDIYRGTFTNTDGEMIATWSTQVSSWVVTKQQRSSAETVSDDVKGYRTIWKFYGSIQDITNKDILVHSNTTYRILGVYNVRGNHMQIDCDLLEDVR